MKALKTWQSQNMTVSKHDKNQTVYVITKNKFNNP